MSTRKVTVFTTQGQNKATYDIDYTEWSELKDFLVGKGYHMDKLKATENINRTDLTVNSAILPEIDFTLFLRPVHTKAGTVVDGLNFKQLRQLIKEYKELYGQPFIDFMNKKKNYTQQSTDMLRETLSEFNPADFTVKEGEEIQEVDFEEENNFEEDFDSEQEIQDLIDEAEDIFGE